MHVIGGVHNHILKHPQLNIAVESTFLKLITGLSNAEITTPRNTQNVPPGQQKPSNVMYGDSEELNRVVILSLARAIHIHGHEQVGLRVCYGRHTYQTNKQLEIRPISVLGTQTQIL